MKMMYDDDDVAEVVLQSRAYSGVLGTENHPINLHGFKFIRVGARARALQPRARSARSAS